MDKYINNFIEKKRSENLSVKTLKAYTSDLKLLKKFCQKNNYNVEIGAYYYAIFLIEVSNYKTTTKIRKLTTTKMFHNYVSKYLGIDVELIGTKIRKEKRLPKTLSHLELTRLKSAIKFPKTIIKQRDYYRDMAIINTLLVLGLRISEISNLNLQDYVWEESKLIIFGKNKKERVLFFANDDDKKKVEEYLNVRNDYKPSSTEPAFFLNKYGKRISIFSIENIFYKYRNLANINKKATPHYLRHSFATELLNNGASIRDIQELLGHSSISTTEIYLYVSSTRKKTVLSNFGYKF